MPISDLVPDPIKRDREKYQSGDINIGQAALRSAGHLGAGVGAVTSTAYETVEDAIVPLPFRMAQDAVMQTLGNKFMESDMGKQLVDFMAANPEAVYDAEAAANALELWPAARGFKKSLNGLLRQVRTKINDFYGPDPKKKIAGLVEAVDEAVVPAVETAFSPTQQATARELGTGKNRVAEALQTEKGTRTDVAGNMMASGFIDRQMGGQGIVQDLPFYQANVKGVYNRGDTPGVTEALTSDYPGAIPQGMPERMWERVNNNLTGMGKFEKLMSAAVDPMRLSSKPGRTSVVVRDKAGPESNLGGEAMGAKSNTSRTMSRIHSKEGLKDYADMVGKDVYSMGPNEMMDFVHSAFPFERAGWLGTIKDSIPTTYQASPGKAHSAYLKAKRRQKRGFKMSEDQLNLIATVDNFRENNKPNINRTKDGLIEFTTSYTSEAKDLGGVGIAMTIDPKTNTTYSVVFDGHDLFGTNPVGGDALWNVTPIQVRQFGKKADFGSATPEMRDRAQQGMLRTAERTGIQPMPGEKDLAYSQRVLSEYIAKPKAQDYANVAENVGMLATAVSDIQPNEETE
mgnify:CR=1 FL=1